MGAHIWDLLHIACWQVAGRHQGCHTAKISPDQGHASIRPAGGYQNKWSVTESAVAPSTLISHRLA